MLFRCGSCIIHTPKEKAYMPRQSEDSKIIASCPFLVPQDIHPVSHHFRFESVLDITFCQQVRECNTEVNPENLEIGAWRNCGEMQTLLQTHGKWPWIINDLLKSKDINWNSKMSNKMTILSCIIYQLCDHMVVDLWHDGILAHLQ